MFVYEGFFKFFAVDFFDSLEVVVGFRGVVWGLCRKEDAFNLAFWESVGVDLSVSSDRFLVEKLRFSSLVRE